MKSVYKKLVSFRDALQLARETIKPVQGTERVPITESSGRILSQDVLAPRNNPPFNRSTMDGYAVRAMDVAGASETSPVVLKVTGESFIGQPPKSMDGGKCCFRISTGAIVPGGADAVVKVEDTEVTPEGDVKAMDSPVPGTNIAAAGSDITSGELLVLRGKQIDTNDIAVFASLGISDVEVYRKLNLSVISTGNELISHREPYREGSISDANGIAVCNELNSYSFIDATYAGIVRDNYGEISEKIKESMLHSDIVILSGGSSAGESDLVYRIIDDMEPGLVFHGVLVKPGLPTVLGRSGDKVVIGLPGFPVSSLMIFRSIFLQPILSAGRLDRQIQLGKGELAVNLKLEMGKQNLIPVTVAEGQKTRVYPVTGLSGSISRFISTTGFISIPGDTKFLDSGTELEIIPWRLELEDSRQAISGTIVDPDPLGSGLSSLPPARFHRMSPRDSLKSLKNGDSVLSMFFTTSDFQVREYIKSAMGTDDFEVFAGQTHEVGIASLLPADSMDQVMGELSGGSSISGPALRFLESIASGNKELARLIQYIHGNLTSYRPSGLSTCRDGIPGEGNNFAICIAGPNAKARRNWISAFRLVPVYVTLKADFTGMYPEFFGSLKKLGR